ncbi:hypothetical protein DPC56_06630 [Methanothermobacter tenebrarum]|uniref:Uncharacterized protein n=1 Tax=Methanothermobacter tenebrarum TaxID=680118 RepID=A0A328PG33_9EURY|nr:hypothetical protein DPC56_06630 [Methanothermobacter tenebrarum]
MYDFNLSMLLSSLPKNGGYIGEILVYQMIKLDKRCPINNGERGRFSYKFRIYFPQAAEEKLNR